ncbi:MAG: hypothetical protein HGN29_05700 [Asgard group archaeon]|nr:hypothetical protein [Asgard group archaeon]
MLSIGIPRKRKKLIISLFFSIIICSSMISTQNIVKSDVPMWLNLTLKTSVGGWGVNPDIALYIADYLEDIGIKVNVIIEPWDVFLYDTLLSTHDFDLALVASTGVGETPDWQHYYKEGGFFTSIFGLTNDMPYQNISEGMLEEGLEITNFEERQQHYYDWQQLMMDKIIPLYPLFSSPDFEATWANILGYEGKWGIVDCLPYMSYSGYHEGQESLDEFNIETNWVELNPLYRPTWGLQFDRENTRVLDLIHEPMIQWSPEQLPIKTGLIYDWTKIDDCHYKFFLRDNVYWNPSYNVTDRDAGSDPLDIIPAGELMLGLKNSEYSDGTNQQVTAKDVVFTLLTFANPNVSYVPGYMEVFSDIYVDPSDPLAFHLHIDGNPETPKLEPYADFWMRLMERIMPEFFLNSTNPAVTYSLGGIKTVGLYDGIWSTPQWFDYSYSAFGCGKYMLDYGGPDSLSVFQRSPFWFGVGAIDGATGLTPFVQTINTNVFSNDAQLAEFKSGKLDWMILNQFPVDRRLMEDDPRFDIIKALAPNFSYMVFNLRRPYISGDWNYFFNPDKTKKGYTLACSLRKAICYAINKAEINEEVFEEEKIIANSVFYPYTEYYYYDDIIKYDRDLEASYDWLYVKDYLPDITVTVKNHDKVGEDMIVKARYDNSFDITSSILKYRVNNGTWINETMIVSSKNSYEFNIGKEYEKNDFIELYVQFQSSDGSSFNSQIYSFNVGTLNPILKASFPKAVVSVISLLMFVLVIRRIKKKRRN